MSSFIMFELEVAEKEKKRLLSYSMENWIISLSWELEENLVENSFK